jgi:hypothetical protein
VLYLERHRARDKTFFGGGKANVRFAPKAIELQRDSELTQSAE